MIEEIESRKKAPILLSFLTQTHLVDSRMFIRNTLAYLVADLAKFSGNEVAHWSIGEKDGVLKIFKEYRKHKDREALRAALKLLPYTCNLDYYPFFQLDVL